MKRLNASDFTKKGERDTRMHQDVRKDNNYQDSRGDYEVYVKYMPTNKN